MIRFYLYLRLLLIDTITLFAKHIIDCNLFQKVILYSWNGKTMLIVSSRDNALMWYSHLYTTTSHNSYFMTLKKDYEI